MKFKADAYLAVDLIESTCPRCLHLIFVWHSLLKTYRKDTWSLQLVGRSAQDTHPLLASVFIKPPLLPCFYFDEGSNEAKRVGVCPAPCSKDILRPALIYPYSFYGPAHRWRTLFLVARGVWLQGHILGSVRLFSIQLNSALVSQLTAWPITLSGTLVSACCSNV